MSIQAYQKTATRSESPRELEFRAFAEATRALMEASGLPRTEIGRRAEALAKNRRLWSILAADCAVEGNLLPGPLRAQIISLSLFVDRHSRAVIRAEESFDVLIDINRTVMQGLQPAPGGAGAGR